MQKVQQQEISLGTVPIQPQAKGNERKPVGYSQVNCDSYL